MSKLYYFAYGSNLHPLRLTARTPSAQFIGLATVPGYKLCFHKYHQHDKSGKCNMYLTDQGNDVVIGAVYELIVDEKPILDGFEGPGYRCDSISVELNGKQHACFVYIAENSHIDDQLVPHCWYKNIVLMGAEYHRLPEDYIDAIRQVNATKDPNADRHEQHYGLIDQMKIINSAR
jgi:gamma-glutamylcyclotransferase